MCACIYEQLHLFTMMKTKCGVKQGLWKCWFRLQNEIKTRWGDSQNEVGFDVYHIYGLWWGYSINLLYCSHLINKSGRSYIYIYIYIHYVYTIADMFWYVSLICQSQKTQDVLFSAAVHSFLTAVHQEGQAPPAKSQVAVGPFTVKPTWGDLNRIGGPMHTCSFLSRIYGNGMKWYWNHAYYGHIILYHLNKNIDMHCL